MKLSLLILASFAALLSTTPADATGRYDRVAVKTTAIPPDRATSAIIREFRMAVQRRDRTALYGMLGPKFAIERDFGGMTDKKLSARKQFDIVLPGWDNLIRLAAAKNWGPWEPGSKLICGPAALTPQDEQRVIRAAKQRGDAADDYWFEWIYIEGSNVSVRTKASAQSDSIAKLSHEAVRALSNSKGWYKVALPQGDIGYLMERDAVAILNDRLCFQNIKGKWRLTTYIGGGD